MKFFRLMSLSLLAILLNKYTFSYMFEQTNQFFLEQNEQNEMVCSFTFANLLSVLAREFHSTRPLPSNNTTVPHDFQYE